MATVYFDAGHIEDTWENTGGKGVRRNGRGYEEHHFNIDVTEQARDLLKANGIDARITKRSYAETESLRARTDEANDHNASLLVSTHANAGGSAADGACIFHWPSSEEFADIWVDNWKDADTGVSLHGNGKHEVIKGTWTNLHIVREAVMPAYIIEHGFMTNDEDFDYIFGKHTKEYRRKAANVIAKSVCEYLGVSFEGGKVYDPDPKEKSHSTSNEGVEWVGTDLKGKRVESIYKGSDGLNFYDSARWSNPTGTFGYGEGWMIDNKYLVDGSPQYRVQNSNGDLFFITASPKYVKVEGEYSGSSGSGGLPTGILTVGDRGSDVRKVQEALASVYFYPNKGAKNNGIDGIYGDDTRNAVRRFQSVHVPGEVDGVYGPNTRKALLREM